MKFRFHPEAALEFEDSVDYNESVSTGLGVRFAKEVFVAIELASQFSDSWPIVSQDIRRI